MDEETLFAAALDRSDPAERRAFLDEACAGDAALRKRLDRLLSADAQTANFLSHGAAAVLEATVLAPLGAGAVLDGRFKLRQKLGAGGMGEVWVADQVEPVQRRIALKLIRPGLDSAGLLARFEQERQALALMDHPGIAKILDAGATETGRPYFVMELIKGAPITEYCDTHQLAPKERLGLFADVCRAVEHAHQKGVIHRDLKPSNVLVALYDGEPVVKVIDFGVAKATGERLSEQSIYTEVGALVGTLEYMSPEQAELNNLDIDTRSDIYALGVILYELLTGGVPHSRQELRAVPFAEMLRIIKEVEPRRPSTRLACNTETLLAVAAARHTEPKRLPTLVRGELDWIVMRCLEKDRNRRYPTAHALALDVERYLCDEPVLAGPPSAGYRVRKFARRHRHVLAAALGFVSLLVAAVVALSIALVAVDRERQQKVAALEAEGKRRHQTRAALDAMLSQVFVDWLAKQPALLPDHRRFLEQALVAYEEFAADTGHDEESRAGVADAYGRVGTIRERLGRQAEAEAAWLHCRELYERLGADFPENPTYRQRLAKVLSDLDDHYYYATRPREADAVSARALTLCRQLAAEFPDVPDYQTDLARALNLRGRTLTVAHRAADAEVAFGEALAVLERLAGDVKSRRGAREKLSQAHMGLGYLLRATNRNSAAVGHYERAVAIDRQLVAEFPGRRDNRDSLARGLNDLGAVLDELERTTEAEPVLREGLEIQRQLSAEFPGVPFYRKGVAMTLGNLAILLKGVGGRAAEAEDLATQSLTVARQLAAEFPAVADHQNDAAGALVTLAGLMLDRQDFAGARKLLEEAVPFHQSALTANSREPTYQFFYRNNRLKLTRSLVGLKDHAAAVMAAREFLRAAVEPANDAYLTAGFLADCVRLAADDEQLPAERRRELAAAYGKDAVAALRQAVAGHAEGIADMKSDPTLDPLRSRSDFQKLLAEAAGRGSP